MIIGVDIGGTSIKAGVVSNNKILRKASIEAGKTKKNVVSNLLKIIDSLFDSRIKGIGIGCPGPADYKKGIIGATRNLPIQGVNIKKIVFDRFRKKVVMANDASCFVLGEAVRLRKKNIAGLTLGTGVGGGIVIDGKLYQGNGNAGHFGHFTIKFDGYKCECGNNGCLEQYVSVKAVRRMFGKEPTDLNQKEWNKFGSYLGIGVANLINSLDPEIVVIGGGISKAFGKFKASMKKEIDKRALVMAPVAKGNEDSGIIGAASLIKN